MTEAEFRRMCSEVVTPAVTGIVEQKMEELKSFVQSQIQRSLYDEVIYS